MKWIVVLTLPSGGVWALGPDPKNPEANEGIALYPMDTTAPTVLKNVFGFQSESDAQKWMDGCAGLSPQGAKMMEHCKPMTAEQLQ